jgi:hypothetical protein
MHPYHSELQVMRALLSARCQDQHYLQWPLCLASCYHQGVAAKLSLAACLDLALLPQALQLGIHIASSLHFSLHCWSETNIQRVTVYSLHCKPRYRFVTNCIASNKLKSFKHRQCQASTVVLQQRRLLCRPGLCGRQCNWSQTIMTGLWQELLIAQQLASSGRKTWHRLRTWLW